MKKSNSIEFITKAKSLNGSRYIYDYVNYVNSKTKVEIVCSQCGSHFFQTPNDHLRGRGCPECARMQKRTKVFGVGIYDICDNSKYHREAYVKWRQMLFRCYYKDREKYNTSYDGCSVCDEWKLFSRFESWFNENNVMGFYLDKDILVKGNKVYSPQTCCFVPNEINVLFTKRQRERGELPIGVWKVSKSDKYQANVDEFDKRIYLGVFDSPEEAFVAYKREKEKYIKKVADKWKDKISKEVYNAMYNYKVEIID